MSNRRSSKSSRSRPSSLRGGSRPIDPRRAPGYAPRRGLDPFAVGLIVVSSVAVLVFLLFIALQGSNNPAPQAGDSNPTGSNVTPDWTKTTVAFSTQTAPDVLPRISLEEAKALYDVGDARFIDVRLKNLYDIAHIKGAVNIPHTDIGTRLNELPRSGNIVLYCQ